MKITVQKLAMVSLLIITAFVVFKAFFIHGPLSLGDAPFFTQDLVDTYLKIPSLWIYQGGGFGRINDIIWISPVLAAVGVLNKVAGLSHDALIRLVFYFPAVLLSLSGPVFVARYLKLSYFSTFFASFVYTFNTFFILLIDGGQVGVALAYGVFPYCFLALVQLLETTKKESFGVALILLFIQTATDIRIALVAVISALIFFIARAFVDKKYILKPLIIFLMLCICLVMLNLFWIIPFAFSASSQAVSTITDLQFMSLLNSVTLFQPHWPNNIFGKITPPPFYFLGIILFILVRLLKDKRTKVIIICSVSFLIFAFLAKGTTYPGGFLYNFMVNKIPFGFAFRDSSKFMFPVILFAGIIIGSTVEAFKQKKVVSILVVAYLLFLIHPAILGKLNFVLSGQFEDLQAKTYSKVMQQDDGFFRAAWFPERHPQAYFATDKISFDAKELADLRPFARLNGGSSDRFNFMNNKDYLDWYQLFGIRYLFLRGNPRVKNIPDEEKRDWDALLSLTDADKRLTKVTDDAYKVPDALPHMFSTKSAVGIVGSDDIYEKIKNAVSDYFPGNLPMIFFEDGFADVDILDSLPNNNFFLYFNQKEKMDLVMSTFKNSFATPSINSQWGIYSYQDYLKYKFELLIRDIDYREFDFAKGISLSTVAGEVLNFKMNAPQDGKYILGIRSLSAESGTSIEVSTSGKTQTITSQQESHFDWHVVPVDAKKGEMLVQIKNNGGAHVVNTAVLINKESFDAKVAKVDEIIKKFEPLTFAQLTSLAQKSQWQEIDSLSSLPPDTNWLIFTDNFSNHWKFNGRDPLPAYSAINLFFAPSDIDNKGDLVFTKQPLVEKGLYFSLISAIFIAGIYSYVTFRRH